MQSWLEIIRLDNITPEVRFYDPRHGPYCGLSNLHPRQVRFEGIDYETVEHAFQVAKAGTLQVRRWLAAAPTPELAAAAGDALTAAETVEGWDSWQVDVMAQLLAAKFTQHRDLRELLVSTGHAKLVEWAPVDTPVARFWGEYRCVGQNTLGRLLMDLRGRLQQLQDDLEDLGAMPKRSCLNASLSGEAG